MASRAAKDFNKGYHGRYAKTRGRSKSGPKKPFKGWVKVIPFTGHARMEYRGD